MVRPLPAFSWAASVNRRLCFTLSLSSSLASTRICGRQFFVCGGPSSSLWAAHKNRGCHEISYIKVNGLALTIFAADKWECNQESRENRKKGELKGRIIFPGSINIQTNS